MTRRVASVLRDADVCTQKQKAAAERVADSTKKREEAERTLAAGWDADAAAENARDAVTCQICYVQRRDALVMPCCHLLYCYRCVTRASEVAEARGHPDRCPCCRGPISGVLRCKLTE